MHCPILIVLFLVRFRTHDGHRISFCCQRSAHISDRQGSIFLVFNVVLLVAIRAL